MTVVTSSDLDFRGMLDASPNPYLVLDRDLHIAFANRAYLWSVKRELPDLLGRWAWEAFPTDPETEAQAIASFERVKATREPDTMALLRFDVPRPAAEGGGMERRWWSITHSPVLDAQGQVALIMQHAIDVTDLERLRDATAAEDDAEAIDLRPAHSGIFARAQSVSEANLRLKAETDRLRDLFEQAPGFITTLKGPEHVFEFANATYRRLFNERRLNGRSVREVFPELEGQGFFELLDGVYRTGERFVAQAIPVRLEPPGEAPRELFLNFIYEPLRDAAGRVTGIFVEGHDVTQARRAEAELRANEAQLRRRSEQLQGLAEVATAVARAPSLEATLDELTQAARRIVGAHQGIASLTRGTDWSQAINAVALTDKYDRWRDWAEMPDGSGIYAWACEQNRPVRMSQGELEAHPRWRGFGRHAPDHPPMRGWLAAPLVARDGRNLGLLQLSDKEDGSEFDEADEAMLVQLAQLASAAVEQSLSEAALRESEARYRTLFEIIDEGFCILEFIDGPKGPLSDYIHVEANPAYTANAGIPDIVGKRLREVVRPEEADAWVETFRNVLLTGEPLRYDRELLATGRHLSLAAFRVEPNGRRQVAVLFQDVTARRQAEERLRELNETLERRVEERTRELDRVWQNSQDLQVVIDEAGVFQAVSPAATRILGWLPEEMVGRSLFEFTHPEGHSGSTEKLGEAVSEPTAPHLNRYRDKEGHYRWISWVTTPADGRIYCYGRDVTREIERQAELEAAQEALRQSQKMEAMGSLTGGVAHDFNNLLTPIVAVLDRLQRQGVIGPREQRLIAGAAQSAERARTLVQRLLAFARRQPLQAVAVDVADLVRGMADLVASTTGPQIRVTVEVSDNLPPAKADPNQLEMALLNLAVNARDAMPEGGRLRISATAEAVEAKAGRKLAVDLVPQLGPGRYVRLTVTDTGTGMDEATLARAVEPFFSTKGVGKGTGLGLSMVHGLASQLGGALAIHSQPGLGTTVELWLPQSDKAPDAAPPPAPALAPDRKRGTALLVDDEEAVRLSTADMLGELGYRVLEAASAEEAVATMRDGARVDLVVTDHLMPGMTGSDLARAVRAQHPGLPILIVSGYAETKGIEPDLPRLAKPFRKDELAASLVRLRGASAD